MSIQVEASLLTTASASISLKQDIFAFIQTNFSKIKQNQDIFPLPLNLKQQLSSLSCCFTGNLQSKVKIEIYCFKLDSCPPSSSSFFTSTTLPSSLFSHLWNSLFFTNFQPQKLIDYFNVAIKFADSNVNSSIINCNKLILLHGPPGNPLVNLGSGKTSLAKALAQKISIRIGLKYTSSFLLQVNCNSLFSKFYAESANLVAELFNQVETLLETNLVVLLIDEVESISSIRKGDSEPTDAIRVVNSLLTRLDQLKHRKNIIVIATTNLLNLVDPAFIDRCDIIQFVGHPSVSVLYSILTECITELINCCILNDDVVFDDWDCIDGNCIKSAMLVDFCVKIVGISGRSVRKIPFLAVVGLQGQVVDVVDFIKAMEMEYVGEDEGDKEVGVVEVGEN